MRGVRQGRWVVRFFDKIGDYVIVARMEDAKARGLLFRDLDTGDRASTSVLNVVRQGDRIIHLIDVIASQNNRVVAIETFDYFLVLMNGISGSLIPDVAAHSLIGRQNLYEFIELAAQKTPGHLNVPNEAMARVLGQYRDASNAGIDRV